MEIIKFEAANWLVHKALTVEFAPMTLICGPNDRGKSSIGDGIAFALRDDCTRIELKGERRELLNDGGASKGHVSVTTTAGTITRNVTTGKASLSPADGASVVVTETEAGFIQYVMALDRGNPFVRLDASDRRRLLMTMMRVHMTPDVVASELAGLNYSQRVIDDVLPAFIAGGFDGAIKHAKNKASEARGAWQAITGETYGAQKAVGWQPSVPVYDSDAHIAAKEQHAELEGSINELNQRLGQARSLRESAEKLADARKLAGTLKAVQAELESSEKKLAEAETAARNTSIKLLNAEAAPRRIPCPACGVELIHKDNGLAEAPGDLLKLNDDQIGNLRIEKSRAEKERDTLTSSVFKLREALARAETASNLLGEGQVGEGTDESALVSLDDQLTEAQSEKDALYQSIQAFESAEQAVNGATERGDKAARYHKAVEVWSKLAIDMGPAGVPGKLVDQARTPLNTTLAKLAGDLKWPAPIVGPDMAISMDGRSYNLWSKSGRWRINALLSVAIALLTGIKVVVIDEMDILDLPHRSAFLRWMHRLTSSAELHNAIILATLKEAPQTLPAPIKVVWLGD